MKKEDKLNLKLAIVAIVALISLVFINNYLLKYNNNLDNGKNYVNRLIETSDQKDKITGEAKGQNYQFVDGHVHSTRYYTTIGKTNDFSKMFQNNDVAKIFLFGSYPNIINNYIASNGRTDDQVTLDIYRRYPNKVYPFAMAFTPGRGNYMQYLNSNVKGKPFVGIGELGFGVDTLNDKGGYIGYPNLNTLGQVEDMLNFAADNHLLVFLHTQRLDDTYKKNPREIDWSILDKHKDVAFISPHFVQFHTYNGFKTVVEKKLNAHCNLYAEMSPSEYKEAMDHGVLKLKEGWRYLLNTYPDRFIIGSDSQPDQNANEMGISYSTSGVYDFLKELGVTETNIKKIMYTNAVFLVENRRFVNCGTPSSYCGNSQCEQNELNENKYCRQDCCGNNVCSDIEKKYKINNQINNNYCSSDCAGTCGNIICEDKEYYGEIGVGYCQEDCCGDTHCTWQEYKYIKGNLNNNYCSQDCYGLCPDGKCEEFEDSKDNYCLQDCCGNGQCTDIERKYKLCNQDCS